MWGRDRPATACRRRRHQGSTLHRPGLLHQSGGGLDDDPARQDKSIPQALALADRMGAMMQGDEGAARDKTLGELRALAGVSKFPVRIKCALLPWNALTDAVQPPRG